MRQRLTLASAAVLLISVLSFAQDRFTAKVVGVADGATISVIHDSRAVTIAFTTRHVDERLPVRATCVP